jgi:uncharacterized protein YbjT (DUF2867 family)
VGSGETILIAGGSGLLGAPVARALDREGYRIRILTRRPDREPPRRDGYEVVRGDVEDEASLERALAGCMGVHISLRAGPTRESFDRVEHHGTARVARLARASGVRRLTYLSGMYVAGAAHLDRPAADEPKAAAEAAIRDSGVAHTIFRPTYFMETLPRHLRGGRAVVIGRQPHPLHMIAADDYARMVARAYALDEAADRTFYVQGREAFTIKEALDLYCRIVGPAMRVVTVPIPVMRIVDRLFMTGELGPTLDLMEVMQRTGEVGDPAPAWAVLGPPTTTLRAWCEARATDRQALSP